jgi:hypothetical protein
LLLGLLYSSPLRADEGTAAQFQFNGKALIRGSNAKSHTGRVYFQCFAGELFYRKIAFYALD